MTRQKQNNPNLQRSRKVSQKAERGLQPVPRLHSILLVGWVATLVATPLIPSEAAVEHGTHLLVVMLLLLIALVWLGQAVYRGKLEARFEPIGTALMVLVGWMAVSAVMMLPYGEPRFAINTVWSAVALVIGFRMCLQLVTTSAQCRAVTAVMISLALGLSTYGIYQYSVSLPRERAGYFSATPEEQAAIRTSAGVTAPQGSPHATHFEKRLNSLEPWATFGLANSLAGFLVPWLVILLAMVTTGWPSNQGRLRRLGVCLLVLLPIAVCLAFTKSRAGYLGTIVGGLFLLPSVVVHNQGGRWFGSVICVLIVASCALVAGVWLVGAVDLEVLTEAPKSLGYRMDYWRSTAHMIQESPWFGCGPGNFQDYYLQHKLPRAGEEIKDPHNFILEIWSTAGTPALLALVVALASGCHFFFHRSRSLGQQNILTGQPSVSSDGVSGMSGVAPIYLGAVAGLLLALPVGWMVDYSLSLEFLLTCVPAAALAAWLLLPWVKAGHLNWQVAFAASGASLINLLFAGGILYLAVSGTLLLVTALGLHLVMSETPRVAVVGRVRNTAGFLVVLILVLACYFTAYRPVLGRADPWNANSWKSEAHERVSNWLKTGSDDALEDFDLAVAHIQRLDSHSSQAQRQLGMWYLVARKREDRPRFRLRALNAFRRAADLYPGNAMAHAEFAWALHVVGQDLQAAKSATEALRLDRMNPHQELRLGSRRLFDEPAGSPLTSGLEEVPAGSSAEQYMEALSHSR